MLKTRTESARSHRAGARILPDGILIAAALIGDLGLEAQERLPHGLAHIAALLRIEPLGPGDQGLVRGMLARRQFDGFQRHEPRLQLVFIESEAVGEDFRSRLPSGTAVTSTCKAALMS